MAQLQAAAVALLEAESVSRVQHACQLLTPLGASSLVLANTAAYARDVCRREAPAAVARRLRETRAGVVSRFTKAYLAATPRSTSTTLVEENRQAPLDAAGLPPTVAAAASRLSTLAPKLGAAAREVNGPTEQGDVRTSLLNDVDRTLALVRLRDNVSDPPSRSADTRA